MSKIGDYQLKQQLKDLIAGRTVKAALFHTFNFSPRFFENYIMPLLVPSQRFLNNEIANHIVWRNLYKEQHVPPITVYFDQDAKDVAGGPMLDYDFKAVRMPSVGKNKGNFHPKHSFILVENENRVEELLIIVGSNNITQNGWCENIECIAQIVLNQQRYYPISLCSSFQEFIRNTASHFGGNILSAAEEKVIKSLNRINATNQNAPVFYDSMQGSFMDFLEQNIFEKDHIRTIEIQSPYFSNDAALVDELIAKGIKVHIQAPLRDGLMQIEQEVFELYSKKGVLWYYPDNTSRNSHRKIYRLHGQGKMYTIIGSVNFTNPAWRGYSEKAKQIFNIESALLFEQKVEKPIYLLDKILKPEHFRFMEPVKTEEVNFERNEVPEIYFEIDWTLKRLAWNNNSKAKCILQLPGDIEQELISKGFVDFTQQQDGEAMLDALARNSLLTVVEQREKEEVKHLYYMTQIGFGQRPSHFFITPSDMIDAWDLLGKDSEVLREWFENTFERLTDLMQDESGKIIEGEVARKSLLNDMARQFYGLSKLEENLFDDKKLKQSEKQKQKHFQSIVYYLTHDNVDTLLNYIRGIQKLHQEGGIMHSYYWLLLQIVKLRFYENNNLKKFSKQCRGEDGYKAIKKIADQRVTMINELSEKVESSFEVDKKLLQWTIKNLQFGNGVY
jgi:HKD family nuclease